MSKGQVAIDLNDNLFKAGHLKGQVATEFFAYSGIFLLIVIITAASIYTFQDAEFAYYENRYMIEVGNKFSSAYNLAVSAGEGFTYRMDFPTTILGERYNITFVENKSILIEWNSPHGPMIYPYPISHFSLEFSGCIEDLSSGSDRRGVLRSEEGNNELVLSNNGEKIILVHGGVCAP